jgi:hypothetical protein
VAGYQRAKGGGRIEVQIAAHSVGICHSDGAYSRGRITSRRTHMEANVYGATPSELQQYGNLNLWQSIMLLQKWSPLINFVRAFLAEGDPYKKSLIVADAAQWGASQTKATLDDEFVKLLAEVVKTPQGEAMARWIVAQAEALR